MTEIVTDEQLIKLYTAPGYLVAVDYPKKEVTLHTVDCMLADPISTIGVKPSKARDNKTGEFWFSESRDEANSKAEEITQKKGINYSVCPICNR
ncbi:MAG: hypothetical protein D4S01_07170 [Dehalococcoidia bacterium]|nr:MAG: hypothetical protein D4S01_07170 [Dehalococcoidia bacterium]